MKRQYWVKCCQGNDLCVVEIEVQREWVLPVTIVGIYKPQMREALKPTGSR